MSEDKVLYEPQVTQTARAQRQSPLREVVPTSTSLNDCGNKKIAGQIAHFRACYTRP